MEIIFSSFGLKILMIIMMFSDHVYFFIPGTPIGLTWMGRLVAPVFFFLVAEGIRQTSNRWAYFYRLFLFGIGMFILNRLLEWFFPYRNGIPTNIFLSLAAAVAFITVLEQARSSGKLKESILPLAIIGGLSLLTEASFLTIPLIMIFFYFREYPYKMILYYSLLAMTFFPWESLVHRSWDIIFYRQYQWMMLGALPFFFLYNGERGPRFKYMFYLFYPFHIYGLYLYGYFMGL